MSSIDTVGAPAFFRQPTNASRLAVALAGLTSMRPGVTSAMGRRMKKTSQFTLQFAVVDDCETSKLIRGYARKYLAENDNATKDERALNAGTAIRNGSYTKANFRIIYEWKLESFLKRKLPYLNPENIDPDDVEEAMRLAATARTVRAAVAVLMGLPGVKSRVASAVLAMIRPDRYTVLDVRALEALGVPNEHDDGSVNFYVAYLAECQKLASRYKVDLRTFDRALFQWSAEQAKSRRPGHRISD
jgi:hypothetical protein